MSSGAWVRKDDNTYGAGRFPFGVCFEPGCGRPSCFELSAEAANDSADIEPEDPDEPVRFCERHLPAHIIFTPFLGQQTKLYADPARWVLGGGGAGGSKTYAGSRLWLKQYWEECARFDEGEIERSLGHSLFLRRTMPELEQVIADFLSYKDKIGPNKWDGDNKCATFECGYKVQFAGIKDDNDWRKYYGGAYTLIVFDEATQFTIEQIEQLDTRLRCADPVLGAKIQLYLLTNPVGGATKAWLKRRYVACGPEERVWEDTELKDGRVIRQDRIYIPCNLYDNPTLMADGQYEAVLLKKGDAKRRALLLNDWDVDEGTWVGSDWEVEFHVCEPFAIPNSYPRFKSGDYGFGRSDQTRTRTSIIWWAVDPENNLIAYRAISVRKMTAKDLGHYIREIELRPLIFRSKKGGRDIIITQGEWDEERDMSNVPGPMDASMWAAVGESAGGESRGEILDNIGCNFHPSDKGRTLREQSAEQIRNRLRSRTPNAAGELVIPGLRFMRVLTETKTKDAEGREMWTGPIHSIPNVPFDPKDPDVWADEDDHDLDATAYEVLDRPLSADKPEDVPADNVVDMWHPRQAANAGKINW